MTTAYQEMSVPVIPEMLSCDLHSELEEGILIYKVWSEGHGLIADLLNLKEFPSQDSTEPDILIFFPV